MKKFAWLLLGVAAVLPAIALAQGAYPIQVVPVGKGPYTFPKGFKTDFSKVNIMVTEKLSPNLFVLHGNAGVDTAHPDSSGGRMAVLFGPDGVLLVDSENEPVGAKSLAAIRTFTQAPIKIMVNSHAHSDHTGGNAFFAGAPPARPFDAASLPVVTYKYDPATEGKPAAVVHMNGETVDFIPMMPSHMGGDTVIKFEKANVIYIEDFYRNFGYPFADQANGGSIKGMLAAVDLLEKMSDDKTILVPGHGTLVHRKDLLPYRAMLVDLIAKVGKLRSSGKSLKDVEAMNVTAPYDASTLGDTQDSKDRFVSELYNEAQPLPPIVDGRRTMPRQTN
jgi:cyclase